MTSIFLYEYKWYRTTIAIDNRSEKNGRKNIQVGSENRTFKWVCLTWIKKTYPTAGKMETIYYVALIGLKVKPGTPHD